MTLFYNSRYRYRGTAIFFFLRFHYLCFMISQIVYFKTVSTTIWYRHLLLDHVAGLSPFRWSIFFERVGTAIFLPIILVHYPR